MPIDGSAEPEVPNALRTDERSLIPTVDERLPVTPDPRRRVNVFVAHKSRLLTEGLIEVFSKERDFHLAGTASDAIATRKALTRIANAVVVVDGELVSDDPGLLQAIASSEKGVRMILLMARPDDRQILAALQVGVRGVILESMGTRLLLSCIRKVHAGEEWIEQSSACRLLHRFALEDAGQGAALLSRREIEVIRGIARGLTNAEIAGELFINTATVKTHVHNVFRKLEVSSRVGLTNWARTRGLI